MHQVEIGEYDVRGPAAAGDKADGGVPQGGVVVGIAVFMVSQAAAKLGTGSGETCDDAAQAGEHSAGSCALVLEPDGVFRFPEFPVEGGLGADFHISVQAEPGRHRAPGRRAA